MALLAWQSVWELKIERVSLELDVSKMRHNCMSSASFDSPGTRDCGPAILVETDPSTIVFETS